MDATKNKIRNVCTVLIACSLLSGILIFGRILLWLSSVFGFPESFIYYADDQLLISAITNLFELLAVGIFCYAAYTFFEIRKTGTLFSERTVKRVKILAIVLFIYVVHPSIMPLMYLPFTTMNIAQFGATEFSFMASSIAEALVTSGIIYGLALAIQYGAMLQSDVDEIV